jgi:hypothetical protein
MTLNYDENHLQREFQCYAAIFDIAETLEELDLLMEAEITAAVRTLSSGIDVLKKLTDLAIKSKNVELQEGMIALRIQLLDVKETILEVKTENSELREENKALKLKIEQLEQGTHSKLTLGSHGYYKSDGEGPFCVGCYDSQGKLHRVIQPYAEFVNDKLYQCSVCEKYC